jgi:hypothetical protein
MWDNYTTNDTSFDIAEDPYEAAEAASHSQFEREVDEFGTWNPAADAEEFGLCGSESIGGPNFNPEEDELLTELMQSACE